MRSACIRRRSAGPAPARPTAARASSVWRAKNDARLSRGSSTAPSSVVEA